MSPHAIYFAPLCPTPHTIKDLSPMSPGRLSPSSSFFNFEAAKQMKLGHGVSSKAVLTSPSTHHGTNSSPCGSTTTNNSDKGDNTNSKIKETPIREKKKFVAPKASEMEPREYFLVNKICMDEYSECSKVFSDMSNQKIENELIRITQESGWKEIGIKNGIKFQKRKDGLLRGHLTLPKEYKDIPPDFVMQVLWENDPSSYNTMLDCASRIVTRPVEYPNIESEVIFHQSFSGLFGFPGRDFVLYGTHRRISNELCVFACKSVTYPNLDPKHHPFLPSGRVRANCFLGGYAAYRTSDHNTSITAVWDFDLKCPLPSFIINQLNMQSLQHMHGLVDLAIDTWNKKKKYILNVTLHNTPLRKTCSLVPSEGIKERSTPAGCRQPIRKSTACHYPKIAGR